MSLLIKGVEMPDSCLNCRFRTTILKNVLSPTMRASAYACLISGMEINNWYEEKHKDCPLVEVPAPHGRLIDDFKLLRALIKAFPNQSMNFYDTLERVIDEVPTIIEAEESK